MTSEEVKKGLKNLCNMFVYAEPFRKKAEHAIEYISVLESRVADLEAKVPKWVSVEDELPACVPDEYLVVSSNGRVFVAEWGHERWSNKYSFGVGCEILRDVTHWMDLPTPPKEEEA